MTSIFVGNGLGLFGSSIAQQNGYGSAGSARVGNGRDGAYVNAATGNLVIQGQDEFVAAVGLDDALTRTYSSLGGSLGYNADGWQFSFERSLVLGLTPNLLHGNISRVTADGHSETFAYDGGSNTWQAQNGTGAYDVIAFNGSGWTYRQGGTGVVENFDGAGVLLSTVDQNGNTLSYTSVLGKITSISDQSGQTVNLVYGGLLGTNLTDISVVGLVPGATSGTQTQTVIRVHYDYDALARLTKVSVELPSGATGIDSNVYTTSFQYDDLTDRVTQIAQSDGSVLNITYQLVGLLTYRVRTVADGLGHTTQFSYDPINPVTTVTDPLGNVTKYTYDSGNRLTLVTLPAINGTTPTIQYQYDAHNNISQVTDAAGRTVTYTYSNGNLIRSQDSLGNTVDRSYDASNHLLSQTVYQTPATTLGQPGTNGLTTHFAYDGSENLRFTVSAQGDVTEYRYDARGERVTTIRYPAAVYPGSAFDTASITTWAAAQDQTRIQRSDISYDLTGQIKSVTAWNTTDASGNGINDGQQSVSRSVYDVHGRLLIAIDPRASGSVPTSPAAAGQPYVTSYVYDGLDRILSTTNGLSQTSTASYDDAHNKIVTTTAANVVTTKVYNVAGDLISLSTTSSTGTLLRTTTYDYDANDRLLRTTVQIVLNSPTNAANLRTYYVYDAQGRRTGVISPNGELTETVYNNDSQVIGTIQYANPVTATLTDGSGNPLSLSISQVRPTTSASDRATREFYDTAGRLVYGVDAAGYVTGNTYDGAGRVLSSTQYVTALTTVPTSGNASDISVTTNASDRTTRYFYDADGRKVGTLDPDGYLQTVTYDAAGEVQQTLAYATLTSAGLRASGTLAQLIPAADAVHDQQSWALYDGQGRVLAQIDANGYLSTRAYDLAGNLTQQTRYAKAVTYTGTQTLASLITAASTPGQDQVSSSQYDALNRVTQTTDYQGTVTQYVYDTRGLLTKVLSAATGTPGAPVAQNDALGRSDQRTTTYGYDDVGDLTSTTLGVAGATTVSTYDAAGHKIRTVDADGHSNYFYYDSDGRLLYTVDGAGDVTGNQYDAFGDVVQTTQYATPISLTGLTGGLISQDPAFGALVSATAFQTNSLNRTTRYTYGDRRGLLTQTLDARSFTTVDTYDAFGELKTVAQDVGATPGAATRTDVYSYSGRGLRTQVAEDSAALNFTLATSYDAFGRVIQTQDARGNLTGTAYGDRAGHTITVTDALGQGTVTTYDAFNRVLSFKDRNGNTTSSSYSDTAQSVTVTSPEGIVVTTVRNRHGQTIRITDGTGVNTDYAYDADGNLLTTTVDPTVTAGDGHQNLVTTRTYDLADLLKTVKDANGVFTQYAYDAANRVMTRTVDPTVVAGDSHLNLVTQYRYNAFGGTTQVIDANNVTTETVFDNKGESAYVIVDTAGLKLATGYTYDAQGRTLTVTEGLQASGSTGSWTYAAAPNTTLKVTQYGYDHLGRRTSQVVDPGSGHLNLTTQYFYDGNGNVVRRIDANGNTTRYVYDADDRQRYVIDPLSAVTETRYDSNGNVARTLAYTTAINASTLTDSSTVGNVQALVSAAGTANRSSWTSYDKDGRLAYAIDALGDVTGYTRDGDGRVTATTRYATAIDPTSLADVLTKTSVTALVVANAGDQTSRIAYDAAGRAVYTVDALGDVVRNSFDGNGNKVLTRAYSKALTGAVTYTQAGIASAISTLNLTDNANDRLNYTVYDAANRKRYAVDALGYVSETRYDGVGRVIKTIKYGTPIVVSALPATPQVADVAAALAGQLNGFYDNFSGGLGGYSFYPGSGTGIAVTNGRLTLTNQSTAPYTVIESNRIHTITATATQAFHYEITPTTTTGIFYVGADTNNGAQYSLAIFYNGAIYVQGQDNGPDTLTALGSYVAGTAYQVDVLVTATSSTVYIYAKGSSRSSGYTKTLTANWATARARLQVNQGNNEVAYVDSLTETTGLLDDDSAAVVAAQTGATQDTFNNGLGSYSFFGGGGSGIQIVDHRLQLTAQSSAPYTAIYGNTPAPVSGSTKRVFRYDFQPTAATGSYYVGANDLTGAGLYHLALFQNGVIYAQSQIGANPFNLAVLGTYTAGQTYIVEVVVSATGSTLYVYPKDKTRGGGFSNTFAASWTNPSVRIQANQANGEIAYINTATTSSTLLDDALDDPAIDQTTTSTYDAAGRLASVQDAENNTQTYTYDGLGNKLSYTNQNGATWTYKYDAAARLTDQIAPQVAISAPSTQVAADGITNAYASVVSPDSKQVYVTGKGSNSVAVFNRKADGSLVLAQVLRSGQGGVQGLGGATNLVLSPDGKNLYVIGSTDNTITAFTRNTSTGQLTFQQTLTQGGSIDGLSGPAAIAVTADGTSVYVASKTGNSVALFTRNTTTGALTFGQVLKNGQSSGGTTLSTLSGASSLAIINNTVFVGASTSNAVTLFARNSTTGLLTYTTAYTSSTYAGLAGVSALATNGSNLYVAGATANSITTFYYPLGITSNLTGTSVVTNGVNGVTGLQAPSAILVSSSTNSVFVASSAGNDLAGFTIGAPGILSFVGVYTARGTSGATLTGPTGLSISPDGNTVYAQGSTDSSLIAFSRTAPGTLFQLQVLHQGDTAPTASTAAAQIDTHFVYDSLGNVLDRVENFNPAAPTAARVTGYSYDADGRQTQTRNADTVLIGSITYGKQAAKYDATTDAANGYTGVPTIATTLTSTVTFDALGNAVVLKDAGNQYSYKVYDTLGRVQYEIDADGYVTAHGYDVFGNQTQLTRYAKSVGDIGWVHTAGTAYSAADLAAIITTLSNSTNGTLNRAITTTYDQLNRKTSVVLPSVFAYDSGTGTSTTTAGPTTLFQYNAFSDQIAQSKLRNVIGGTTTFDTTYDYYDQVGHRTAEIDPLGYLTQYQYTTTGKIANEKEWGDKLTFSSTTPLAAGTFNATGFVSPLFSPASVVNSVPTTVATNFGTISGPNFASSGGQITVVDTINNSSTTNVALNGATSYSGSDTNPTDIKFSFSLSGTSAATGPRYIGFGNWGGGAPVATTFGLYLGITGDNKLSVLGYDGVASFSSTPTLSVPVNSSYQLEIVVDGRGATLYLYPQGAARGTGYSYRLDTIGSPASGRTQVFAAQKQGTGTVTPSGSVLTLTSVTENNGNESTLSLATLVSRHYSNVRETRFAYDRLDQQTSVTRVGTISTSSPTADGRVQAAVADVVEGQTVYDGVGNVIASTDAAGATTLHFYNALGNEVSTVGPAFASTPVTPNPTESLTTYTYDAFGNQLTQTAWASGAQRNGAQSSLADVVAPISVNNLVDAVSVNNYDILGRITSSIDAAGREIDTAYDVYGHKAKIKQDFNGNTSHKDEVYQYNNRGLQTSAGDLVGTGLVQHLTGYDAFGDVVSKGLSGAAQGSLNGAALETYAYDNAGRLTFGNANGVATVYLSDLESRTTANIVSPTPTLPALGADNSPASAAALTSGVRRTENVYDADGRVTSQKQPTVTLGPLSLTPSLALASVNGNTATQLNLRTDRALPVGTTASLSISLVGSNVWSAPLSAISSNFGSTSTLFVYTVSGRAAGLYQYRLTYSAPNLVTPTQPTPIYAVSGTLLLQGAGLTNAVATNGVTMSLGTVGGLQSYIFTPASGVSLNNMVAVEIGTTSSTARYGVVVTSNGSGGFIYSIPVTSATQFATGTVFRPIFSGTSGFNQSFTYSSTGATLTPTAYGQSLDALTQLFGGRLTPAQLASLGTSWQISGFKYLLPTFGATWQTATVTYPSGVLTISGPGLIPSNNFSFQVTLSGANNAALATITSPNGGPLGDSTGLISSGYSSTGIFGQDLDNSLLTSLTTTPPRTVTESLDRWGNVLSKTDATGIVNTYRYDDFNRTIENVQPILATAGADRGIFRTYTPTTEVAYDAVGRTIATIDPNGNLSNEIFDAVGHLVGQISGTRNASSFAYDQLGNQVSKTDGLGNVTSYTYDLVGELISEKDPAKSAVRYNYDELGDRISDSSNGIVYVYDAFGHVLTQKSPRYLLGDGVTARQQVTSYGYDALGNKTSQQDANGNSQSWTYDYFGRLQRQVGLGSVSTPASTTVSTYDSAGEKILDVVTAPSTGAYAGQVNERAYAYYDSGQIQSVTDASGTVASISQYGQALYTYDAANRLTHQVFIATLVGYGTTCPPTTTQDTVSQYDSDGHLWNVYDSKGAVNYRYDAAANRKLTLATAPDGVTPQHVYQYDYNADNKVTNSVDAELNANGTLTNTKASEFQFDAAGNRVVQLDFAAGTVTPQAGALAVDVLDQAESGTGTLTSYGYDGDERLKTATSGTTQNVRLYNPINDQLTDYQTIVGGVTTSDVQTTYNLDGTVAISQTFSSNANNQHSDSYLYDNAGNLTTITSSQNSGGTITYNYSYQGGTFGSYLQNKIVATNSAGGTPTTSTQTYDVRDQLTNTTNNGSVTTNNDGLIVTEGSSITQPGGLYIYQGDQLLGNWQYPASGTGSMTASFGYNFTPVSNEYPAVAPGSYIVNSGDTLQSIAQQIYGDSSLWYVIADANGIQGNGGAAGTAGSGFSVGQALTLPNKVVNSANTATTFRPYNASQIIGNQNPPAPIPPPPNHHCNAFAAIVIAAVAVVATIVTAGAAAESLGAVSTVATATDAGVTAASSSIFSIGSAVLTGGAITTSASATVTLGLGATLGAAAIGGAAGSIASQLAGDALGVSHGFNFAAVAVGALTAAATSGVAGAANGGVASDFLSNPFVRSGLDAAASQGIGVVLGQQNHFSWSAVAAGALVGGATLGANGFDLNNPSLNSGVTTSLGLLGATAEGTLAGIARTEIGIALGGHGKLDVATIAADSFGNALGNSIVGAIRSTSGESQQQGYTSAARYSGPAIGGDITAPLPALATLSFDNTNETPSADAIDPTYSVSVGKGDTLSGIVNGNYDDTSVDNQIRVAKYNQLASAHQIQAGQSLALPDQSVLNGITVTDADRAAYETEGNARQQIALQQAQAKAQAAAVAAQAASVDNSNLGPEAAGPIVFQSPGDQVEQQLLQPALGGIPLVTSGQPTVSNSNGTLRSALLDTARAGVNSVLDIVEGVPNLLGGSLPGTPDYLPFLRGARLAYDTPAFGATVELLSGFGAGKALGALGKAEADTFASGRAPLDQSTIDQILATPKGLRPDPSSYLPADYIESHLSQFDDGASRFTLQSNLNKYGLAREDGTTFVLPRSEADQLVNGANGNSGFLEQALGLPEGTLQDNTLVRVDIPNPRELGLRIPSGNEAGANSQFIPGGRLPNGNSEAVVDVGGIPASRYNVTPLYFGP